MKTNNSRKEDLMNCKQAKVAVLAALAAVAVAKVVAVLLQWQVH